MKEASRVIIEDVDEEVASLTILKESFELWKREFREQYEQAYASFALPKLLAPRVKLELLTDWDPMLLRSRAKTARLCDLEWYRCFQSFCNDIAASENTDEDQDRELLATLVEGEALPLLENRLLNTYDPASRDETLAMTAAMREIVTHKPSEAACTQLQVSTLKALKQAVESVSPC